MPDLPTCHEPLDGLDHGKPVRCPNCQGLHYHDVPERIAKALQALLDCHQSRYALVDFPAVLERRVHARDSWDSPLTSDDTVPILHALCDLLGVDEAEDLVLAVRHNRFCGMDDDRPLVWCPTCSRSFYPVTGAPTKYNAGILSNGYTVCPKGHVCATAPFQNYPMSEET